MGHREARMFLRIDPPAMATLVALTAAGGIPVFNVEPHCRAVAAMAAPVGDPEICLRQERAARAELARQWPQFASADRAACLQRATLGPEPTYTHLLTCLELQREARRIRGNNDRETVGQGGRQ
jgi:hypothetical protein